MVVQKSSNSATSANKGKVGKKTNSSSGSHNNGKPFQLLNSIITKDDITPLSKSLSGNKVEGTVATAKDGSYDMNNVVGFAACDNQTENSENSTSGEAAATVVTNSVASTPDPDLLFSPLNSGVDEEGDDDDEEDVYDHELLSPIYFTAQYPKRFHRRSSLNPSITEQRNNSLSGYPLNDLLGNATSEDFWKEVSVTNEEAIYYPEGTVVGETSLPKLSTAVEPLSDTSFDEFITEDLTAAPSSAVDSNTWDEDYKIKLLCYRDATGKLRLKTEESNNYTVSKQVNNSVRKTVSRQLQKKGKKNKNKLLKHAIRRKSGVWEMVSTGIGIGEFML